MNLKIDARNSGLERSAKEATSYLIEGVETVNMLRTAGLHR